MPSHARPPTHRWADLTSKALAGLPRERIVAVLPVGAIESHGPHLPLSVDTDIANGLMAAVEARLEDLPVLILPTCSFGKSDEHRDFPGTLTLSAETLARVYVEIGGSVAAAGVRRLVFMNAHGGNVATLDIAARALRGRHRMLAVTANWFALGLPAGLIADHEAKFGIHGGTLETAMMRAIAPDRVVMAEARYFRSAQEDYAERWRHLGHTPGARIGWLTQDLNPAGACGDATAATAEIGRAAIDHVADRLVEVLAEVAAFPLDRLGTEPAWR